MNSFRGSWVRVNGVKGEERAPRGSQAALCTWASLSDRRYLGSTTLTVDTETLSSRLRFFHIDSYVSNFELGLDLQVFHTGDTSFCFCSAQQATGHALVSSFETKAKQEDVLVKQSLQSLKRDQIKWWGIDYVFTLSLTLVHMYVYIYSFILCTFLFQGSEFRESAEAENQSRHGDNIRTSHWKVLNHIQKTSQSACTKRERKNLLSPQSKQGVPVARKNSPVGRA